MVASMLSCEGEGGEKVTKATEGGANGGRCAGGRKGLDAASVEDKDEDDGEDGAEESEGTLTGQWRIKGEMAKRRSLTRSASHERATSRPLRGRLSPDPGTPAVALGAPRAGRTHHSTSAPAAPFSPSGTHTTTHSVCSQQQLRAGCSPGLSQAIPIPAQPRAITTPPS